MAAICFLEMKDRYELEAKRNHHSWNRLRLAVIPPTKPKPMVCTLPFGSIEPGFGPRAYALISSRTYGPILIFMLYCDLQWISHQLQLAGVISYDLPNEAVMIYEISFFSSGIPAFVLNFCEYDTVIFPKQELIITQRRTRASPQLTVSDPRL